MARLHRLIVDTRNPQSPLNPVRSNIRHHCHTALPQATCQSLLGPTSTERVQQARLMISGSHQSSSVIEVGARAHEGRRA